MLLSTHGIELDADIPINISLTRPTGATYNMMDVQVMLALKTRPASDLSIFEASTTPVQYLGLDRQQRDQSLIDVSIRTSEVLSAFVVMPKELTTKALLRSYRIAYYTLWMTTPAITLAIETDTCPISRTSVEARIPSVVQPAQLVAIQLGAPFVFSTQLSRPIARQ